MEPNEPPVEGEYEEQAPKAMRGRMAKIAAVVVVLAVAGASVGAYTLYFTDKVTATFAYDAIDLHLAVSAEKSLGPIASYLWDWGDNSPPGHGVRAAHDYAAEGNYNVSLSVAGHRIAKASTMQAITIKILPSASFVARHDRMNVSFDASYSYVSDGTAIKSYQWDFGDGAKGEGIRVTHTYQAADRFTATLTVTDSRNRTGSSSRFVSPADTTVDVLEDEFFSADCPYPDYWYLRNGSTGDLILNPDVPCVDYYPWVLFTSNHALQNINPSWLYTIYRQDARVRNHPGYNLDEPVFLPTLNPDERPGAYIKFNLTLDYMNETFIKDLNQDHPEYPINKALDDGYGYLVRGSITVDLQESKRMFGVVATSASTAQQWWKTNTKPAFVQGPAEKAYDNWMTYNGNVIGGQPGSGKYDIYNGFEWYVQTDLTDLNATVDPDGTTHVSLFLTGWGWEALMARWFYWGKASYLESVNSPYGQVKPAGWMPMEVCWCEHGRYNGSIRTSLDLDYKSFQTYHFQAWANWGPDGVPGTSDDLPAWVWGPWNLDYVPRDASSSPGSEGYPNSELRWYEGKTTDVGTPGSYSYGQPYEYTEMPARWTLAPGYTLTLIMPKAPITWYDPVKSHWNAAKKLGDYTTFYSPLTLRQVCTTPDDASTCSSQANGDYYTWDSRGKMIAFAGPHQWPDDLPLQPAPWVEFAPETAG